MHDLGNSYGEMVKTVLIFWYLIAEILYILPVADTIYLNLTL